MNTFTAQIDDCRNRQERDRGLFAQELLGLQEAANERHRTLRAVVERQGQAQIAFEKGFRSFFSRYQGEIEDLLLTLQENTAEKYLFLETTIDAHYGEFSQITTQIESITKQGRRRSEALHDEFRNDIEALNETIVTRDDIGRIVDWIRQDLLATISDRNHVESIQNALRDRTVINNGCSDRDCVGDDGKVFRSFKIGDDDPGFTDNLNGESTEGFEAVSYDCHDAERPGEAHADADTTSEQILNDRRDQDLGAQRNESSDHVPHPEMIAVDRSSSDAKAAMEALRAPVEEPDYLSAFEDDLHDMQAAIDVDQPGSEAVSSAALHTVADIVAEDEELSSQAASQPAPDNAFIS